MRLIPILTIAAIALMLLLSAACTSTNKPTTNTTPAGQTASPGTTSPAQPTSTRSTGQTEFTPTTTTPPSGTTSTGNVPSTQEWPADIPIMEGLTNAGMTSTGSVIICRLTGDVEPAKAAEYYEKLPGWTKVAATSPQPGSTDAIAFIMEKIDKTLSVRITKEAGKTLVEFVYQPKQQPQRPH